MQDALGNRIKTQYEDRTRYFLPRRTYTIIRIDGKAFHTFTKYCKKPFDAELMYAMDKTAEYLCKEIQGAEFAYVQSDEISILLTDFTKPTTNAWFDGNIQKITSISASMATVGFNNVYADSNTSALFDSRVFTIPDIKEVENYFIWRQQDASRNSVQMVARSLYSHKQCNNKNNSQLQDMIHEKGLNWNDFKAGEKRGRVVTKEFYEKQGATRSRWVSSGAPIFTKEREFFNIIPKLGGSDEKIQL